MTEKTSMFSAVLPVTTMILMSRLPTTPSEGRWLRRISPWLGPRRRTYAVRQQRDVFVDAQEKDVIYQLVRRPGGIHPMAEESEFENDPVYPGFLDEYDPLQSG